MNECSSISDPKFGAGATSVIYLPYGVTPPPAVAALSKCGVKVENLPKKITGLGTIPVADLNAHGLLYLPNKYVVPGGRFNEMYGWDSYFIIVGLLEDGERDYSRGIIENFFYEIENYGAVLNANRAYYLTRSQPPFLTSMIMAQYAADKKAGQERQEVADEGLRIRRSRSRPLDQASEARRRYRPGALLRRRRRPGARHRRPS